MRKLRPAERALLESIPGDVLMSSGLVIRGRVFPHKWDKGTNQATLKNLWRLGFIQPIVCGPFDAPMGLTSLGKEALGLDLPSRASSESVKQGRYG